LPRKLNEEANVTDYLLGLDDLQQPKVIDMSIIHPKQWNSAVLCIARLILMRKGQLEDHPNMGIDIRGRYSFAYDTDLTQLNQEIQDQVAQYLPEFTPVNVFSRYQERDGYGYIAIAIVVNQIAYQLVYNLNSATIEGLEEMG